MTEPSAQEQTTTINNAPANVEVDTSFENDSSYGDELSSYSASLTSSVIDYRHENGRRYHKFRDGSYLLPNDEAENDRLDIVHELCLTLLHRKLYLAPIKNPQRVIDLGTGTGIWAIDFADQHPEAEVIGCDLSPVQPTMVPPNVKFLVDDIESEWAYESDPFDFIHARYLVVSIKDFGKLIKQCYRSVKPGGWVEFQDWDGYPMSPDGSLNGTALQQYYDEVWGAFEDVGYEVRPGPKLEQWFKEAGFVNIHVEKFVIPYGVWPKDPHLKKVGAWNQTQAEANGFEAGALAPLTRFRKWTKEEVIVLASKARADGRNRDIHMMNDFYVVYAQRPEN
jgi:Methylase involved in ubiquinone/menaquinone biosynthesis